MPELNMKQIFDTCQRGSQHHTKMLKLIRSMYANMEFQEFFTEFVRLLKFSMVVYKREPAVERTIDVLCKFISSPEIPSSNSQTTENDTNTTEDDPDNILLIETLEFLLQHHNAGERAVRFRCCQMINKLLNNLAQNAMIDDNLFDRIYTCMLERMRDKVHLVRQNAVLAISRLQDPHDDNCPTIKAYLFLMTNDLSPCVRRAVLDVIGPSSKTLPYIIERTRDANESVRQLAYVVIAEKVHIKCLSIAQRLEILENGLNDQAEIVKDACSKKVLQKWLCLMGGNILELLKCLDVENSMETCEKVVEVLFKQSVVGDLVANFDLLDDNFLVTSLTCESSMYWRSLLSYVKSLGQDHEELLEKILPNCLIFASYLRKYVEDNEACDDLETQLEIDFILQQLLMVIDSMDLSDEAGRRALEKILHDMLVSDNMRCEIIQYILPRLKSMKTSVDALVNYLAETISEIREPLTIIEKSLNKEQKRNIDLKVASIRVKLNQVKEEMEECVRNQEFARAAELKLTISELDSEKSQLLESAEPMKEEVRTEKNDTATVLKCMTIIHEMLKLLPLKTLSPTLQMMLDVQILPGVQNSDENVRNEAVWSLGLCCQLKQEVGVLYLPLLMQVSKMDTEEVRTSALKCMFDLIHVYGLDVLKDPPTDEKDTSADLFNTSDTNSNNDTSLSSVAADEDGDIKPMEYENVAAKLIAMLSSFLDSESEEMCTVAAEGLAKLLLCGRIVSAKTLSHLLILWFNPVTEENAHLRQCLGAFFSIYSFTSRNHQEIVEEAFMPTIKTIMEAPTLSPLSDIDISKVCDVLVQLVNTKRLFIYTNVDTSRLDNPGHDNICMKVCDVIISKSDSIDLKHWTRILNQLNLSPDETNLKDVIILCEKMLDVVKESSCLKAIDKFKKSVEDQLAILVKPTLTCSPGSGEESGIDKTLNVTPNGDMDHLSTTLGNTTLDPETRKTTARKTRAKSAATPSESKILSSVLSKSSAKRYAKKYKSESEQENPLNQPTSRKSKANKNLEPLLQEEDGASERSTRSALYEVSNSDV